MSQNYTEFPNTDTLTVSHSKMIDNYKAFRSLNSGAAFPATLLYNGTPCWRTDTNTLNVYNGAAWVDVTDSSNISFSASGNIIATNVQSAIQELDTEKQPLSSVLSNTTASFLAADRVKLDAISGTNTGDQVAATVSYNGSTNLIATNVEAALDELDTEKVSTSDIGTTVQAYDATTLVGSDIGTTVQAYDATHVKSASGITDLWTGSQAAYDDLTPVSSTLYFIQ